MIVYDIECQECNATCLVKHNLNTSRYDVSHCPICGGENIELEEYEENEDWD
jgi:Zn finger protein HypA/HybF involved in hydrogenase expression